ncbi:hypothetical protein ACFQZV_09565 [Microbacterium koreense]|uniref:DUF4352 domain-containing protein n=1 Tax=Microbacterium koreense TaxID=323761 RepID=A0ABW2ZS97_9MICO
MSYPQSPTPDASASQTPAPTVPEKSARNVIGIVALALAAVGFIFACIPGALIVGWILLPVAFVLSIIGLVQKNKAKWQALAALIISVVGTIVGFIVFFAVVAASFNDAFGSDVEIGTDADSSAVVEEANESEAEEPAAVAGTRENPLPLGTSFSSDEWEVVVNSVTLGAEDEVMAANQFNEAPEPGHEYILVNYSITYVGDDAEGGVPAMVGLEYVTAGGNTIASYDTMAVAPDAIDTLSTLYEGASISGNTVIAVPSPADGVLAISPGMFSDTIFVAIQ